MVERRGVGPCGLKGEAGARGWLAARPRPTRGCPPRVAGRGANEDRLRIRAARLGHHRMGPPCSCARPAHAEAGHAAVIGWATGQSARPHAAPSPSGTCGLFGCAPGRAESSRACVKGGSAACHRGVDRRSRIGEARGRDQFGGSTKSGLRSTFRTGPGPRNLPPRLPRPAAPHRTLQSTHAVKPTGRRRDHRLSPVGAGSRGPPKVRPRWKHPSVTALPRSPSAPPLMTLARRRAADARAAQSAVRPYTSIIVRLSLSRAAGATLPGSAGVLGAP